MAQCFPVAPSPQIRTDSAAGEELAMQGPLKLVSHIKYPYAFINKKSWKAKSEYNVPWNLGA